MTTYMTLTILTSEHRPSVLAPLPNPRTFGGFALLIARRDDQVWQFQLHAGVALAGSDNAELLEHLADVLPPTDHAIGWQIDSSIVDPLMIIAERAPPVVRHYVLSRMARAFGAGSLDLALGKGGLRAPPFAEVVAKCATADHLATQHQVEARWHEGDRDAVTKALCDEAISLWRMFLSVAPRAIGDDVIRATDRWVEGGAK
jgi:hypothetical protein